MGDLFTHSPLTDQNSFRILKLSGSSDSDAMICCYLEEASLLSPADFEAISYTWEEQSPSQPILCCGKRMLVTRNCESALRHFRPTKECQQRFLWIDSICINQDPTGADERNHQVGVMGRIYSKATQVLIWLQPAVRLESYKRDLRVFEWFSRLVSLVQDAESEIRDKALLLLAETVSIRGELFDFLILLSFDLQF
jgi:hypothetical protein